MYIYKYLGFNHRFRTDQQQPFHFRIFRQKEHVHKYITIYSPVHILDRVQHNRMEFLVHTAIINLLTTRKKNNTKCCEKLLAKTRTRCRAVNGKTSALNIIFDVKAIYTVWQTKPANDALSLLLPFTLFLNL